MDDRQNRKGDQIDAAIDSADPTLNSLATDLRFPDGTQARIIVPFEFDSDKFETLVASLMQLRVLAEQRKAQRDDGLVLPDKPKLVSVDGRKLS